MERYTPSAHVQAIRDAEAEGFVVIRGSATKILLDYDDETSGRLAFYAMYDLVDQYFGMYSHEWYQSKTPGHAHCVAMLRKPVTPLEALLIQACLGSDPRRELHGLEKIRQGISNPSVLFRPFQKAVASNAASREVQF